MKPPRSELPYASFLMYSPRGDTKEMRAAKNFVIALKENRVQGTAREPPAMRVARRMRERDDITFADDFLGKDRVLVPVPRSGLRRKNALWPALEIANALHERGFGSGVLTCLERKTAVPKAATATSATRPKARAHFESLVLSNPLVLPSKIVLIDDVVTRGAQIFGAAWRIWSAPKDVDVVAFAVVRTISNAEDFKTTGNPCIGKIVWSEEECRRRP